MLIVPEKIDSRLVRYASDAFNDELLAVGVSIHLFQGGLLHTKSMVIDEEFTVFGTVNLDLRSFELNFEVSIIVYDREFLLLPVPCSAVMKIVPAACSLKSGGPGRAADACWRTPCR